LIVPLTSNGDGATGIVNANGDYSGSSLQCLFYRPEPDEDVIISSLDISIIAVNFDPEGYGNRGPLSPGIGHVWKFDGSIYSSGIATQFIITNRAWVSIADDVQFLDWGLTPIDEAMLRCRIDYTNFYSDPQRPRPDGPGGVMLKGHVGDEIRVCLNEDFTALAGHYFTLRGSRHFDHTSSRNQEVSIA
jgi:hypothetical protein